jgi:hypothetical protein
MTFEAEIIPRLSTDSRQPRPSCGVDSRTNRSAVTNGTRLFMDETFDYRTREARRFRDILAEILSDLGNEGISEGQRQLARRASLMCLQAEILERECVAGKEIDIDLFGQLSDRIGRAFQRLDCFKRVRW